MNKKVIILVTLCIFSTLYCAEQQKWSVVQVQQQPSWPGVSYVGGTGALVQHQ